MGQIRGVIGGFNGPGFRSQGLGKVTGTRGFLSNNLPFRHNQGLTPYDYPFELFANGEQGAWYDPSDFSTMYQDSGGTTPVTAVGQPVGKLLDKSGRGNHAIQATAANRPILTQDANGAYYLAFNGTNSSLATAGNVDLSGTSKLSVFSGIGKASDAAIGTVFCLGNNTSIAGYAQLFAPRAIAPSGNYGIRGFDAVPSPVEVSTGVVVAPDSSVITGTFDATAAANSQLVIRRNGAQAGIGGSGLSSPFANAPINIGWRGSDLWFTGRLYSLIVRGAISSATEISNTENYINNKSGGVF